MGDIRIVAGILQGTGLGAACAGAAELQAHLYHLALGQGDVHRIMVLAGQQQACCRKAGGGGAAASGQAAAQGRGLFTGFFTHREA